METLEDQTEITYFAGVDSQDYDTFEEAKQAVLANIASIDQSLDKLVRVKRVHINEDGTYQIVSGKLTHEDILGLTDDTYLCLQVYGGSDESVVCHTSEEVQALVGASKAKWLSGDIPYVTKETMLIHDQTLDSDFEMVDPSETFEGVSGPLVEGVPILSSEFVNDGTTPNLTSAFEYEKVRVYG